MKNVIVLEINGKKDVLGNVEIKTPSQFLLVNTIEPVLNNTVFDDFVDDIFTYVTEELVNCFDERIDNVYATLVSDWDEFVCSIVLDKFKPKKGTYRMKVIDWKATGYTFKYADNENIE